MQISDFDFILPEELIAQYPLAERSGSRLCILNKQTGNTHHTQFNTFPEYISEKDLIIFNDTRVIPARLYGQKQTGGKLELLIERILDSHHALAHIKASKPLKPQETFSIQSDVTARMLERREDLFLITFEDERSILQILNEVGHIPLPPYVSRADEKLDQERYQTVYARNHGAVAAPTAGLHFDEKILQQITEKKVEKDFITLHVGAGTFQPVRVNDINQHKMHSEYCEVTEQLCQKIRACKERNGRVIAVGTTVVRALETASQNGQIQPFVGETNIFIYPSYQFKCVDSMLTNFHLPKSTLLMLVSAFAGTENIKKAYADCIAEKYRFFSYGDAMFIF